MSAVTHATKEIVAKISNDMWDRQKQWEIKRDALQDVIRTLAAGEAALLWLSSAFRAYEIKKGESTTAEGAALKSKAAAAATWDKVSADLDRVGLMAALVSDIHVTAGIADASKAMKDTARAIFHKDVAHYPQTARQREEKIDRVLLAIRNELGIRN